MHPVLQRKLLRYLRDHTDNQYIIATHSAHMLDTEVASVFHVEMTESGSVIAISTQPGELAKVAADLGYRASDLVQANAIVWVEGPSDRTYLKRWLQLHAPDLVEGIHFSIMFYGGSLLKHLSGSDLEEVEEFVQLQRLNRHVAILIDSDVLSPDGEVNAAKARVVKEVLAGDGFAWVTEGYTIENYVPTDLLNDAVSAVHPSAKRIRRIYGATLSQRASSGSSSQRRIASLERLYRDGSNQQRDG